MTVPDYTAHSDGIFDQDKPILGSTGLETRDNLAAVAGGGVNAPRIRAGANAGSAVGDVLLVRSPVTRVYGDRIDRRVIGDGSFRAQTSGSVRVKMYLTITTGVSGTPQVFSGNILKNGVSIGGGHLDIQDVDYVAGDVISGQMSSGVVGTDQNFFDCYLEYFTDANRINGGG